MSGDARFFREAQGVYLVTVRLTPKGGRDAIDGVAPDAEGHPQLLARVSAIPEDGRANAALVLLVAKAVGLPKSRVAIVAGQTSRVKTLRLEGGGEALRARLEALEIEPR